MTMFNGIDTDKATLIASQKKPDRDGYRHSLYRAGDGRLFIRGVHEENQKLPPSMRRATTTLMETKEDHARKWLVWNGYPELVERVFPEIPESQASVSILKSGPIPGADCRENTGGGLPDPGKLSGGNTSGQAGKKPEGTGENPVLRDAQRRSGIGGSSPSTDGGNPLVRNALRRTRAEGSAPEDEEKKPEKDDEANQGQGEEESGKTDQSAAGDEDKDPEKTEESALVRDAMKRQKRMTGKNPFSSGSGRAA